MIRKLDGWIARRFNMQSIVGTIIDPMADKTLMTILTVTLAMQNLIPSRYPVGNDSKGMGWSDGRC